jgi:hypothetical protein
MRPLIDCPDCACLLDTREPACPFCGAVVRRTDGWSVLGLGFMIGLATAACGDKSGTSTGTESTSTGDTSGTDATGTGTGTTGTTDVGTTIGDSAVPTTFGETAAYAGPDTTIDTLPDDTSTTESATDTGTDTGTGTDTASSTGFPETSAYAGPDTSGLEPERPN